MAGGGPLLLLAFFRTFKNDLYNKTVLFHLSPQGNTVQLLNMFQVTQRMSMSRCAFVSMYMIAVNALYLTICSPSQETDVKMFH